MPFNVRFLVACFLVVRFFALCFLVVFFRVVFLTFAFGTALTAGQRGEYWKIQGPTSSGVGSLTTRYATAPGLGFVPGFA